MQTVHVRVNDAATGRPTPCRLRITGPDGTYYAPFGRLPVFATEMNVDVGGNVLIGHEAHAYIDGTCEVRLPPGRLTVSASKGPEYVPLRADVNLIPGKLALRLELRRWADPRAEGWYSGDMRCHFLTPHAALLEAAAEDVAVVNLLVWDMKHEISNILSFSGTRPALEAPGHLVVVNTMNCHSRLGRLLLLNSHRPVYPLTFGGPDGADDWSLSDWCDQCHRKGGLVVGDNFFGHYEGHTHGELLADLILGKVDALKMDGFDNPEVDAELGQESVLKDWYGLLDCGLPIPLVGGSAKDCNLAVLGMPRTYARLARGEGFTYKNWIEAVRAGRTFVTNGPLLSLGVDDEEPGAVVELATPGQTVRIRAEARSITPFKRLQVLGSQGILATADATGSPASAVIDAEVAVPESGWFVARCWGPYDDRMEQWVAAQSSPVYVRVRGRPLRPNPSAVTRFLGKLDKALEWVRGKARCETEQQRERLAGIFQAARQELLRRAGSAR